MVTRKSWFVIAGSGICVSPAGHCARGTGGFGRWSLAGCLGGAVLSGPMSPNTVCVVLRRHGDAGMEQVRDWIGADESREKAYLNG